MENMSFADMINLASNVVAAASVVAAIVPNPQVAGALGVARKLVDFLACNWGNAANAKDR